MDMTAAVWTLIGVIIAGGAAFAVGLRGELRQLGSDVRGAIGNVNTRIDEVHTELHGINRTLGELVAKAHVHDHVA